MCVPALPGVAPLDHPHVLPVVVARQPPLRGQEVLGVGSGDLPHKVLGHAPRGRGGLQAEAARGRGPALRASVQDKEADDGRRAGEDFARVEVNRS